MSKVAAADAAQGQEGDKASRARPDFDAKRELLQVSCLRNNKKEGLKSISF